MKSIYQYSKRNFSKSVYLWTATPTLGPKASEIKQAFTIPKGIPKRIDALDDKGVKSLVVGQRHSAVVTEDGKLYTFGSGNWGVLGHGSESDVRFDQPKLVDYFQNKKIQVKDVAVGEYHTAVVSKDGEVYTWGYGGKQGFFNWMYTQEVGALGHGDKQPKFLPKKVEYFEKNKIRIKTIKAGLYHTVAIDENNEVYAWGRGLYGVLGNGSNQYSLVPELNEDLKIIKEEDSNKIIKKLECADDYTCALMEDGSLFVWGKNDRGQMGVGAGVGIDMIESENSPVQVNLVNTKNEAQIIKDFTNGQNTMLIQDENNQIYKTGLKLDYSPRPLNFDSDFTVDNVTAMGCGRKHYVILNGDNKLLVWGNVFKEKPQKETEGFGLHFANSLFQEGKVLDLSMKYSIYGAIVDHN